MAGELSKVENSNSAGRSGNLARAGRVRHMNRFIESTLAINREVADVIGRADEKQVDNLESTR